MPSAEKQEWHSYSVSLRLRSGLWAFDYAQGQSLRQRTERPIARLVAYMLAELLSKSK